MRFVFAVEIATLTRENDKTKIRILPVAEVDKLIAAYEKQEAEAEAARKEKQKSWNHTVGYWSCLRAKFYSKLVLFFNKIREWKIIPFFHSPLTFVR